MKSNHAQKLPQVIDLTKLKPKKVSYLWEPYLPNKFCLLDGKPDVGKSQYYLYVSARITCGMPFFTEDADLHREPRNVIIVQAEDDVEDTLLPRLHAAGADLSRVILLKRTWNTEDANGKTRAGKITFNDLRSLHTAAEQYRPKLIVMDPFNAFVAGRGTSASHARYLTPLRYKMASILSSRMARICHHITPGVSSIHDETPRRFLSHIRGPFRCDDVLAVFR